MINSEFNINQLTEYREDNRLEVKKASGGLPHSIWETYSSFANTDGGVIVLGIEEDNQHQLHIVGVTYPEQLIRDFWNTINNQQKISLNILTDKMVYEQQVEEKTIVIIEVPRAEREMRPIYVGTDPLKGTYRRNNEGDFHCSREQVSAFFRDASPTSIDTRVLTTMDSSVFCQDTIRDYRIRFNAMHVGHTWTKLDDELFLRRIGAMGLSQEDNQIHPTIAGLLMFGYEYEIVREFSQYFLDYQERMDPSIRWTHRVVSSSGDWSGNIFDFYFRIINRLTGDIPVPFRLENNTRVDDTKLHEAVREALLNTLVHADYYGRQGTVVIKTPTSLAFANPGDMRISLSTALEGGVSDPRNATLLKMFGLIGIGERAGSGIPNIISSFQEVAQSVPSYKISYVPERVFCTIEFDFSDENLDETTKKSVQKSSQKTTKKSVQKSSQKTSEKSVQKSLQKNIDYNLQNTKSEEGNSSQKTTEKSVQKSSQKTTKKSVQKSVQKSSQKTTEKSVQKIITLIQNNPLLTTQELATLLNINRSVVARHVKKLKSQGILRRVGPDKGGHWEIIEK